MEQNQFDILESKLDIIIKLMAMREIESKSKKDSILFLVDCGFEYALIEQLTSASKQTIYNTISQFKGKEKKGKSAKTDSI